MRWIREGGRGDLSSTLRNIWIEKSWANFYQILPRFWQFSLKSVIIRAICTREASNFWWNHLPTLPPKYSDPYTWPDIHTKQWAVTKYHAIFGFWFTIGRIINTLLWAAMIGSCLTEGFCSSATQIIRSQGWRTMQAVEVRDIPFLIAHILRFCTLKIHKRLRFT